jgi:putative FmdB family regulatory protein
MPIYEYQCQSCSHALEALQKISENPLRECPACGEEKLKKKVSAAAFRLKGGGWYETDFKTGDKKNIAGDKSSSSGADSSSSSGAASGDSSKSDSSSSKSSSDSSSTSSSTPSNNATAS